MFANVVSAMSSIEVFGDDEHFVRTILFDFFLTSHESQFQDIIREQNLSNVLDNPFTVQIVVLKKQC